LVAPLRNYLAPEIRVSSALPATADGVGDHYNRL